MTKGAQLAARIDERWASHDAMPPGWVLDRAADLKFTGGYKITKSNLCRDCNQYRAANGTCGC